MIKSLSSLLVVIYVLIALTGGVAGNDWWYDQLGLSQQGIEAGKYWQLLSYGLLHGNLYHLVVNVVLLWLLGTRLESVVGGWKSLSVVLMGVFVGGFSHLVVGCWIDSEQANLLVGVSGGLMALLLYLTTLEPYRVMRPLRIRAKHLGLGFLVSEAVLILIDPALRIPIVSGVGAQLASVMGDSIFMVAHACHLGGGIAGLSLAKFQQSRG